MAEPPAQPLRVMGVDTSLRSSGIGILDVAGSVFTPVYYGLIKNPQGMPLSACLLHIREEMERLITEYMPHAVAIEGVFYGKNVKTSLLLAHARGVVVSTCAAQAIPVFEYEPRRVKQAVVGYGGAEKVQVQRMIRTLLGLNELPQNDAADALALALTHCHCRTGIAALQTTNLV
ncbi:MAG: crossover junction endodeoxyribonuclease RuvC [Kiritimatiellae bacterium]|nr:crossover junction endodeoxyribonuclease RuvC [Kiritimatiellia bacterium]